MSNNIKYQNYRRTTHVDKRKLLQVTTINAKAFESRLMMLKTCKSRQGLALIAYFLYYDLENLDDHFT